MISPNKGLLFKRKQYCLQLDIKSLKLGTSEPNYEELSTHTSTPNSLESNYNQFSEDYLKIGKIGEGMHSVVYKVEEKMTGRSLAAKVTKTDDETLSWHVEQEYTVLNQLEHEGIMKAEKLFKDKTKGIYVLISELIDMPQVHEYRGKVDLKWLKQMLYSILNVLKYLHAKNLVHRDISSRNVLANENAQIKIIDFGLAEKVNEGGVSVTGVKQIAPPELVGDQRIDIWNVGMIILELTSGKMIRSKDIGKIVKNSEWRIKWGNELTELVESMLTEERSRITAQKALEMKIFTEYRIN